MTTDPGFRPAGRYGYPGSTWLAGACLGLWLALGWGTARGEDAAGALAQRPWFEVRTTHFHTYSCGPTQAVARLTARLEQFREAYSGLAGNEAVASPPVVVMAFPNRALLQGFLPLYQGKPANLAAFFARGSDENLIVLHLSDSEPGALGSIFHEYSHLLLRRNEQFWPMWLNEGMAEIYSTFEVTGNHSARIGLPLEGHLRVLAHEPLRPLAELLAVTRQSPQYNERERQGMFYAESWLLAHFLMLGDNPAHQAQFGLLTTFLRQGQSSISAFTNAFHTPLPVIETQLRRYLERGRFEPLRLAVKPDLHALQALSTRGLTPVEVHFRLGDVLLRIGRPEAAESCFREALRLAPASPLPLEGLGLLASERGESDEAVRWLRQARQNKSASFLAHFAYARERMKLLARGAETHDHIEPAELAEIRTELDDSLRLMPDFGPAQRLLGILDLAQGGDPVAAEKHLRRSIQLEPERTDYLLSLAQAQWLGRNPDAARHTLQSLRLPYVAPEVRARAEQMLKEIGAR